MATTPEHDARVAALTFAGIYPHYVTKIQKKGSLEELHEVLHWLTGLMRQNSPKFQSAKLPSKNSSKKPACIPMARLNHRQHLWVQNPRD